MSTHHYPIGTLSSDYLRVAVGLALTLGPLLLLDLATPIAWLLSILAVLFVWFGLRTVLRQLSAVEVGTEEIAIRGPARRRPRMGRAGADEARLLRAAQLEQRPASRSPA